MKAGQYYITCYNIKMSISLTFIFNLFKQGYKLHKLETGPPAEAVLTKSDALVYYRQMKTIRCMEEAIANLFEGNYIRGQTHLATGQV